VEQSKPLEDGRVFDWAAEIFDPILIDPPRPVGFEGGLNREHFFAVLNGDRDGQQATFDLSSVKSLGDIVRSCSAVISVNAQLRLYVDEWLNTGVSGDGVEVPATRDLTRAPNACAAVRVFTARTQLLLWPVREGVVFVLPTESGPKQDSIAELPIVVANRLFCLFLLCDWRVRLAKCRWPGCGLYFELKHWNRAYKRGILCPECRRGRSLASAVRSTADARDVAEKKLYRLAARRFRSRLVKGPSWQDDPTFRTKLIDFLNSRIKASDNLNTAYPHGITSKWLSWAKNRDAIEEAAKGTSNAKG
jgi:hypothetical protein